MIFLKKLSISLKRQFNWLLSIRKFSIVCYTFYLLFLVTCSSEPNWQIRSSEDDLLTNEDENNLVIIKVAPDALKLVWKSKPGVSEYVIWRSDKLGWKGHTNLLNAVEAGDKIIKVTSTNGLEAGDMIYIGPNHYYIDEVINETTLKLSYPLIRSRSSGFAVKLSACWVKDYSDYKVIKKVNGNEYIDRNLEIEKDYFYILGNSDGSHIISYSNPVNVKLTEYGLLYDAALGLNGGYAWKVGQDYSDTPNLIDGNYATYSIRIQYNDPALENPGGVWRGFHRINLNDFTDIKRIEISQDMRQNRVQATRIMMSFDDSTMITFDLENDPLITRVDEGNYRLYKIPVDKTSSYVNVYIENVTNINDYYTSWNKIGVYTDQLIEKPVTSATHLNSTNIIIDFSEYEGTLPTTFGTDEVYNNVEGLEQGWMLNTWPYTKEIFNLYRIQTGDTWPRHYGYDLFKIGELDQDISEYSTRFVLKNIDTTNLANARSGSRLKIDSELMRFSNINQNTLTVHNRGYESTPIVTHKAGTPVYLYKGAGQILRFQEMLPEFKMIKIPYAYESGISPINQDVPLNDPSRYAIIENVKMAAGDFNEGDVIRIGREIFEALNVEKYTNEQILTLQRGFDGTNRSKIQHNSPTGDVYKIIDYEPYYEGFKNDPTDYSNYYWDTWKITFDKVIKDGDAIPWIIVYSAEYAANARGRIKAIETIDNARNIQNNVIVDEYNDMHDDGDWWYFIAPGNNENDGTMIRGNMYQYYHSEIHILTGDAAGKVFYIRSHTGDSLRVAKTINDTWWTEGNPEYVNLIAEGVNVGDVYKIIKRASTPNVAPKYWQYNADVFYNLAKYIRDNYDSKLADRPIYMEYCLEPNLELYGTWTKDSYIDSYNVFADTIRNGGPHFSNGFSKDEVILGAGAIAGGLNPGNKIKGASGDYDFALSLIDRAEPIDFISHHRYHMGSRVQKRQNSWEYWMLRKYAQSKGKDIMIIDSEDSVATAGGTGHEESKHWAEFSVPYWQANFINSYYGEYGELGRLDFIIHFRLYYAGEDGWGMVGKRGDEGVLDLVYWPIKMYQNHTSKNRFSPDTLVKVIKGWDNYGWIQAMGTINGETGQKKVHLVNKKETAITVNLTLLDVGDIASAYMDSVIGGGPKQTITDGYHPPDLEGAIIREPITDFSTIILEPFSASIITIEADNPG